MKIEKQIEEKLETEKDWGSLVPENVRQPTGYDEKPEERYRINPKNVSWWNIKTNS